MAKDEQKGGLFSRFKKNPASDQEAPSIQPSTPPAVQQQSRNVMTKPETKSSLASAAQPVAPVAAAPAPAPAPAPASSDSPIDTVEAFNVLCISLVDMSTSQLKVIEMALSMLSNSLNKILNGPKAKE